MNEIHSCFSERDLQALEDNQLSQQQLEEFESHLSNCAKCRDRFDAADSNPLPLWESEICPALRDTFELGLPETRADDTANHETFLRFLSPSEDPRMLGRIGNYEVVGIIGQGGMGVVFKAFETSLNRFVAIKMLLPHLTANGAARKRFLREAQAAAAVVDDHVLPIFGVDQWQETPYLVMKYSAGQTLQQRITQQGPLELKEVLRIGTQAAKGLAAAHAQGLVHRDIKPSNILLDGGVDRAVLMDFGLARAVDDASLTRTGIISGTPQYMSPEQVRADAVDARSDHFSLGSTLYAMCAGRPPFRSESAYGVMHRITHEEPTPICEVNSDVPIWMGQVIQRLMSKTAEERYESADEVAELLEGCLAHVQQPTTMELPKPLMTAMPSQSGASSWGRWAAVALFAFFFALAGILLVFELSKGKLVIECAADDVPIRIMQGDVEVEKLTVSKEGKTIKIAAGKYRVEIDGDSDEVAVQDNKVVLTRGGVQSVAIELKSDFDPEATLNSVIGGWTPPPNPDPTKIRREARRNADDGDFEQALAKYLWYHDNAVRIQPSQSGVRRTFALSDWLDLGEKYAPALAKMREVRDTTEARIRDRDRVGVRSEDFRDFVAINKKLGQEQRTVNLFKWLDGCNAEDVPRLYRAAEEALIKQREYKICGKYIEPEKDVSKICQRYEMRLVMASKRESDLDHAKQKFVGDSACLVEILVRNDRETEAQTVVDSFKKFAEEKNLPARLKEELDSALKKKLSHKDTENALESEFPSEVNAANVQVAPWTIPNYADPQKIYLEAKRDREAGNYEKSLAKKVWYHHNSLRIQPSERDCRVSFAIDDWLKLGEVYPPALAKMREIRDALKAKMRDTDSTKVSAEVRFEDFREFEAFNSALRDHEETVERFKWLRANAPGDARRVYSLAAASLIKQREYKICRKYIDPVRDVINICRSYELEVHTAKRFRESNPNDTMKKFFGELLLNKAEEKIVSDSSILVEILVMNGRQAEAIKAAERLKQFAKDEACFNRLDEAIVAAMEKEPHQ